MVKWFGGGWALPSKFLVGRRCNIYILFAIRELQVFFGCQSLNTSLRKSSMRKKDRKWKSEATAAILLIRIITHWSYAHTHTHTVSNRDGWWKRARHGHIWWRVYLRVVAKKSKVSKCKIVMSLSSFAIYHTDINWISNGPPNLFLSSQFFGCASISTDSGISDNISFAVDLYVVQSTFPSISMLLLLFFSSRCIVPCCSRPFFAFLWACACLLICFIEFRETSFVARQTKSEEKNEDRNWNTERENQQKQCSERMWTYTYYTGHSSSTQVSCLKCECHLFLVFWN